MINHARSKFAVSALGLSLVAGLFALVAESAPGGQAATTQAKVTTTIVVTAGKPSELAFKLSKTSLIPAGTLIFKVKNTGKIGHTFEICLTPRANATANTCTGKTTRMLQPGQSQTLTVTLRKKGKYEFLCTVPGHASAGMKGLIGVGVVMTPRAATPLPTTPTKTTPTTTASATSSGGGAGDGCPAGQTIQSLAADDHDDDDIGGPTDGDGCV